jgi:hypothetical protein
MKAKTGKAAPALAWLALLLLAGCQSAEDKLFKPRLAKSHYDAASTHVAVLSVAPWNDMVDKLQPGFTLTGDGALARSLPGTQLLMNQLLEATNASLRVALPTTSITRAETNTLDQTGTAAPTETRNVTEEERSGPGTLPDLGPDPSGGRKVADLPGLTLDPNKLENQAVLEYQTANALFQQVQILNNYVRYAVKRTGFTPYLVSLQVTVLPTARNEPYDVFADIAFMPPQPYDESGGVPETGAKAETEQEPAPPRLAPLVIPLLVTDDCRSLAPVACRRDSTAATSCAERANTEHRLQR